MAKRTKPKKTQGVKTTLPPVTQFITLAQFAKRNGKSKSAAIRLYRQGRLAEFVAVEAPVVLLYATATWPERAEYGTLSEDQRAAWPKGGK